jgi:hypothetical protein
MSQREPNNNSPTPSLATALGRLVGAYLGLGTLVVTYFAAVLSGVSAPSALLRALVMWLVFSFLGRILGSAIGRSVESTLRSGPSDASVSEGRP